MKSTNVWRRMALVAMGLVVAAGMSGCISTAHFVDGSLKDIDTSQFQKPDPLHPVQVLFNFKSKGVDNPRATSELKARIVDQVGASGLFSAVSELPAPGGALLTITVNNVAVDPDAMSKGVATGLTFGLAGNVVTDGYDATASYTPPGASQPIVKQVHHAILSTVGNHAAPPNATPTANINEAVSMMLHQVVSNLLNNVSHDASFK